MFKETSAMTLTVWLAETPLGKVGLAPICVCEYLPEPEWVDIPGAFPQFCRAVEWQSTLVPVLQLCPEKAAEHSAFEPAYAEPPSLPVLLLFTLNKDTPVIGVTLSQSPQKVVVEDAMSKDFCPDTCGFWQNKLLSGFVLDGASIPLIDPDLILRDDAFSGMHTC